MSRGRGGRSTYLSHRLANVQIKRSSTDFLRSIYPEFYRQGAMQSREDWLRLKHKIGRKTGIDPETGRKYREAEPETKWYPPSGAAPTEKGRKAQEAKVGFGAPKLKRKKPEPGGGDDQPPGPDLPVSRTAMPRVKVEEQFSPEELLIMRPPAMSEEQRSAYESSILQQRRTGVPTVDHQGPGDHGAQRRGRGRAPRETEQVDTGPGHPGIRRGHGKNAQPGRARPARAHAAGSEGTTQPGAYAAARQVGGET